MRKYPHYIFSFLLLLNACGGSAEDAGVKSYVESPTRGGDELAISPEEYNNNIVTLQDTVMRGFMKLASAMARDDHAVMDSQYLALKGTIEYSKKEMEKMGSFNGDTELKEKGKALFQVYESVLAHEYKRMIEIVKKGNRISPAEMDELAAARNQITQKELEMDSKFQQAQMEFARKNQMALQEHPQQHSVDSMAGTTVPHSRTPVR